jgi:histidyl-tRNA synthetase
MKFTAPRGTRDIWGKQAEDMFRLEKTAREVFSKYNFSEIRLPTFEDANLFVRSIGTDTDIVEKEMYVFSDLKGRKLALRPEGTASVVRAYIENGLEQKLDVPKLFYMGPMYRYERPQAGRYREFFQIGAEYFSNDSPAADAEIILLARDILFSFGVRDASIHLNTLGCPECRKEYKKVLLDYLGSQTELCDDCKRRSATNPLRVLDCKIDRPKLKDIPKMEKILCEKCRVHFNTLQELLKASDCVFEIDNYLVRGLDYYTGTIFEVRSSALGSQDAVAAGGRYDGLVKELGGPAASAVGFALGSDRVIIAREASAASEAKLSGNGKREKAVIFVAVINETLAKEAFKFATRLRQIKSIERLTALSIENVSSVSVEGPFPSKSLKSQFRLADKINADIVIIFGEDEMSRGVITVRDMKTQSQKEINLKDFQKTLE